MSLMSDKDRVICY